MIGRIVKNGIGWMVGLLATNPAVARGELDAARAASFVSIGMAGIDREFPNKPGNVMAGPDDVKSPSELHPVFFGHFDWHSSVHGHWMLLRMLRLFPDAPFAAEVRGTLDRKLTADGLEAEAAYFRKAGNAAFERMYGWAWALELAGELQRFDDPDAKRWAENFAPLEVEIIRLAKDYLPKLDWPVRCGFHPETAFPLAMLLDHARLTENPEFENLLVEKARRFYQNDRNYPVSYEPSGNDFFSPGLNAADLMRRVLTQEDFSAWLTAYFPDLAEGKAGNLLEPVTVSDPSDPQLIHLAGLNFNRAWTMRGIASALPDADPRRRVLTDSAKLHVEAGLIHVASGHYEGEHWLATFAVLAMTGAP